jgi:hypothetical protein
MGLKGEREKTTRTNVPTKECRPLVVEQEMGADSYLHHVSCSEILRNVALKKGSTSEESAKKIKTKDSVQAENQARESA